MQPYDLPNGYFSESELGEVYSIENNHWVGHRVATHLGHQNSPEIAPTHHFWLNHKVPPTMPSVGLQPIGLQPIWTVSSHQNCPEIAPTDNFLLNLKVPPHTKPSLGLQPIGLQPILAFSSYQNSPEIAPIDNFRLNPKFPSARERNPWHLEEHAHQSWNRSRRWKQLMGMRYVGPLRLFCAFVSFAVGGAAPTHGAHFNAPYSGAADTERLRKK